MDCRTLRSLAVIACLLAAGLAEAATTSRLEGKVLDEKGAALANAEVTITSESLIGGPGSANTDADGSFSFNLLPVGEYTVSAELAGYVPTAAAVPVRLDRTASVTLSMVSVSFSEEIAVSAQVPIVDVTRTNMGEVFTEEYLQQATIGSDARWYVSIMDQAAGVTPGGIQSVFGATFSENAYLVDGFNTVDATTGASATRFSFDAVEEASVLTGGLDAEFGNGTGGVVNVVTKSGGNAFSGTFDGRYRDDGFNESGDHYDPDEHVSSNLMLSATLGGPIVRDRLWFFVALENEGTRQTPVGAPVTRVDRDTSYLGKLTWAINAAHRLTAKHVATPSEIDYASARYDRTAEATHSVNSSEPISQVILDSLLSDSSLLTVGLGFCREHVDVVPMVNDADTPVEYDIDAGLLFSNPWFVEHGDRFRDHHRAKLSHVLDDAVGSHQLDVGAEYHKLREEGVVFTPGGYVLWYFNNDSQDEPLPDGDGDGLVDAFLDRDAPADTARDPLRGEADGWSAFVQDQWRPLPHLTFSLGLRYEAMRHTNTVGRAVADFTKWIPRVGMAWDVTGTSRHVLRAGWGRYAHLGVTNVAMKVPGIPRGTEEYWGLDILCAWFEICDRETAAAVIGPELIHVDAQGDEHPYYLFATHAKVPDETVDTLGLGSLRVPYRDELTLAYETRLAHETSVEVSYVRKRYHDQIDDTCNNNTWAWGDGQYPSLDDPSTWTDEAACTGAVKVNLQGLSRTYEAVFLRAASRARSWFHVIASYTYSKLRGNNMISQPYTGFGTSLYGFPGLDYDTFPNNFVNVFGNLPPDFRHFVKLNGYAQLPWDLTLGVGAFWRSGGVKGVYTECERLHFPSEPGLAELERLGIDHAGMRHYCQSPNSGWIILEPEGRRRGPDQWQLDLQLSKGLRIGNVRLLGIVSVFNIFDQETPTDFTSDPFDRLSWGTPVAWQQPRRWEAGLRVEF